MNEVFKKVEEILEELRCEAEEREYFVQTEQAEKAAQELKKVNREDVYKRQVQAHMEPHRSD